MITIPSHPIPSHPRTSKEFWGQKSKRQRELDPSVEIFWDLLTPSGLQGEHGEPLIWTAKRIFTPHQLGHLIKIHSWAAFGKAPLVICVPWICKPDGAAMQRRGEDQWATWDCRIWEDDRIVDSVNGRNHQTIFRFPLKMENDETELKITIAEI